MFKCVSNQYNTFNQIILDVISFFRALSTIRFIIMSKKTKRILRIVFIIASISFLWYFVPWILVKAWVLPLPDTVQEQAK